MRLIDADLLTKEIESLRCTLTGLRAGKGAIARAADEYRKSILQSIDDQPTAFDKEKVKEELTAGRFITIGGNTVGESVNIRIDRAVEIVEKGGIE